MRSKLFVTGCAAALAAAVLGGCAARGEKATSKSEMDKMEASGRQKPMQQPDAQMQAVLDELASLKPQPIEKLSPNVARQQPTATDAVVALLKKQGKPTTPDDGVKVEEKTVPGAAGDLKARLYTPTKNVGDNARPMIVYFRGGGWVIATLDTYEPSCRALAAMTGANVLSVDYRQAPEHAFPAAHEDAYAVTQWAIANAAAMNGEPGKVAVVGESAGGNMAAAVCLMARDRGGKMPCASVMIYPVATTEQGTPSQITYKNAKPLNTEMLTWFVGYYAPKPEDKQSPYLNLLKDQGSLKSFPQATVLTAEIDPLHSEGEAWAAKLKTAGVDTKYVNFEGVTHEFFGMGAVLDQAKTAETTAADRLKEAFARRM